MPEIKGLQKTSLVDYPGKVSAVVFFGSCNFRCPYCFNQDLVLQPDKVPTIPEQEFFAFLESKKKWLDAVSMSISGNETVLVKRNGKLRNVQIKKLWDKHKPVTFSNGLEIQKCDNIGAFTKERSFLNVKKIIRHKTKAIYDITVNSGYRISATGSHSVFVITRNGLKFKKVSELSTQDYFVSPKKINTPNAMKILDVSIYFEKELIDSRKAMLKRKAHWMKLIRGVLNSKMSFSGAGKKYGHNRHTVSRYVNAYKAGALEELCYISRPNLLWISGGFLWKGRNRLIPTEIRTSKEFSELLGYAVAEGSSRDRGYNFSLGNEPEFAMRILKIYRKVFKSKSGFIHRTKTHIGTDKYDVIIGGKYIGNLFDRVIGHYAQNKRVPIIIFNTNKENQRDFIIALNRGDGHVRERLNRSSEEFSIKTVSRQLASDLVVLFKSFGIHPNISIENAKGNRKTSYKTYIHGNQYHKLGLKKKVMTKYSFMTNIEGIPKELLGMESHIKYGKQKRVNPDTVPLKYRNIVYKIAKKWNILEVKEIRKRALDDYVYDLVVPKDNSFIGGLGLILLHNTGGEPTLHQDLPDFIKKVKALGFLVALETNGTNPEMLKQLLAQKLLDYIEMDIKAPLGKYQDVTNSRADVEKIQQSIELITSSGIDHEFRSTILPRLHSKEDVLRMARMVQAGKVYYLQQFRPGKPLDPAFAEERRFTGEELEALAKKCSQYIKTEIRA